MVTPKDVLTGREVYGCDHCGGIVRVSGFNDGDVLSGDGKVTMMCDDCGHWFETTVSADFGKSDNVLYGHRVYFENGNNLACCRDCMFDDSLDDSVPLSIRNTYRIGMMKHHDCGEMPEPTDDNIIKRIVSKVTIGPVSKT